MKEETKHSVCRMCHAFCDLEVKVKGNEVVSIIGAKNNPVYQSYICVKGIESASVHSIPSRLLQSQKRTKNGSFTSIGHNQATQEIAEKVQAIIDQYGPESVAAYHGTYAFLVPSASAMTKGLLDAMGSPMLFTCATIDQPGKATAPGYHGSWLAGAPPQETWDALLLVGTNPLVSLTGPFMANPSKKLKHCLKRGMKMVVIDPRKSEIAKNATVHLQCRPGEDSAILAGIIHCLVIEDLIDAEFVSNESEGLQVLQETVAAFTPDYVAERAGINANDLVKAARIVGEAKKGMFNAGTGTNMAGHCTLVEYLGNCIHTLRGWWLRAGETKPNPGALIARPPLLAASPGPQPVKLERKMRFNELHETTAGLPTAVLPDEILAPGKGQIKALIVVGGNPMMAFPRPA